jgi:hypothetical protein
MMQGGTDLSVALLASLLNDDSTTCRKLIALQPLPCIGSDGSSGATGNLQSFLLLTPRPFKIVFLYPSLIDLFRILSK